MVEISQRMALQQKQSPQQVLLSTLLQLPVLSLEQRIKMELQENPVLEEVLEEEMEMEEEMEPELKLEQEKPEKETEEEIPEEEREIEIDEKKDEDIDWDMVLDEEEYEFRIPRDPNEEVYEAPPVSVKSLQEHLLEQLHLVPDLTEKEIMIGENIIWNINEDGYLGANLEEIALNLDVSVEEVEKVLKIIQRFDPVGIGARDLRECLLIQLEERGGSEIAKKILREHYEDFRNKRFEKIAKKMEISLDDVREAMEEISHLNPKPGEGFSSPALNYVVPDVIVERVDDDFVISLNESHIPNLRISPVYRRMLANSRNLPREVRSYLRKRVESARWLINSIHQRRATIYKVVSAIVKRQREFFEKGPGHLKPMILKDIADDVGMDISTISRVTNGKYVQTDYGVFELKYFFSEKLRTADGEEVSNKMIKERIRQIIENEDPHKPLTDQQIVEILKKEGVPIARRTVAKYREQLGIPVARLRRRI